MPVWSTLVTEFISSPKAITDERFRGSVGNGHTIEVPKPQQRPYELILPNRNKNISLDVYISLCTIISVAIISV